MVKLSATTLLSLLSTDTTTITAFAPSAQINSPQRLAPSASSTSLSLSSPSSPWMPDDTVTLVPKFKIKEGMRDQYMAVVPKFLPLVEANEKDTCRFYGFVGPTEDNYIICREGYINGESVLKHLDNVGEVLNEALQYADIVDLMVQGPAEELEKLKEPLKDFGPAYYVLNEGAIRSNN